VLCEGRSSLDLEDEIDEEAVDDLLPIVGVARVPIVRSCTSISNEQFNSPAFDLYTFY